MKKKEGFTHESQNNKSVDWYTPFWIFEALGLTFDLDPCGPVGGVPWIPAKKTLSLADDGLAHNWVGRVWLNPPYGKETPLWLRRMHHHCDGVALVFARTDCAWFHDYISKADAILFLKGRVKFVDAFQKTGGGGPGSGSMLVAWGSNCVEALREMAHKGYLVENV